MASWRMVKPSAGSWRGVLVMRSRHLDGQGVLTRMRSMEEGISEFDQG